MERGWKPNVEICPPCPRCGSSNTKFCYYNNYSLTQPRYFCKGCRRYWTKGGSLRNIPVGGGCRKTRRAKSLHIRDTAGSQSFLAGSYGGSGNIETSGGKGGSVQPTNIDLQEVYANFLNQRPDQVITHQEHMQAQVLLPNEVPPMSSFGFTSMDFGATNFGSNLESLLSEGSGMQFCGYNSIFNNHEEQEKQYFGTSGVSNCGLPPLPGEELGWPETNIGFSGNDSGECSVKMFDLPASSDTIFRP